MTSAFRWGAFQQDAFQIDAQAVTPCSFQDYVADGYVDGGFVCGEAVSNAPGGVRKKRQRRQYLEVDGKLVPFKSEADIYAYLDSVQEELVEEAVEVASKAAITVLKGENVSPPKAVIVPIEIIDSSAIVARVEQINKAIQQAYLRKLEIDAEMDDEEALLLLL